MPRVLSLGARLIGRIDTILLLGSEHCPLLRNAESAGPAIDNINCSLRRRQHTLTINFVSSDRRSKTLIS